MNNLVKIDLFKLIDEREKRLESWVMANGENLKEILKPLIEKISINFGSKRKFANYLMSKYNLSQSVSERFVWLMKDWVPLILIREVADLVKIDYFDIQNSISYLKINQPPLRVYRAVKELSEDLCKIVGAHAADGTLSGNLIRITDGYKSDLVVLSKWLENSFDVKYKIKKVKNSNEWAIEFHSGVISLYLRKVFDFPSGTKVYTVSEPEIIRNASLNFRKSFALGALTFEAGVGMKHQVDLCVSSKEFRDSIADILVLLNLRFTKMKNMSGEYWRLWSNKLTKDEANKWIALFEPNSEKWLLLNDYINGYRGKASNFEQALSGLDKVYPSKSASKVCLKDVLMAIKELNKTHRYELVSYLCKKSNLNSYGGKWAHSLMNYLNILKEVNAIYVTRENFGKKKSFGSIVREVYIYNPNISEWKVPFRDNNVTDNY
ncbi:MAG: hypothetical protein Q8L29_03755 [archaeon]|nr:hypothetical protein [archaeon]